MTQVTANDKALVVAYKLKNKFYNVDGGEHDANSAEFDEYVVAAGTSFDVPGELVHVRELEAAAPKAKKADAKAEDAKA